MRDATISGEFLLETHRFLSQEKPAPSNDSRNGGIGFRKYLLWQTPWHGQRDPGSGHDVYPPLADASMSIRRLSSSTCIVLLRIISLARDVNDERFELLGHEPLYRHDMYCA